MPFLHDWSLKVCRLSAINAEKSILNGYRPLVVLQPSQNAFSGYWKNGKKEGNIYAFQSIVKIYL